MGKFRAEASLAQRDRLLDLLQLFKGELLGEIEHRNQLPVGSDGFPSTLAGEHGSGTADPTGSTVVELLIKGPPIDPQGLAAVRVADGLAHALHTLEDASRAMDLIVHCDDKRRNRPEKPPEPCERCGTIPENVGSDRLRDGFCQRCYKAWCRTDTSTVRGRHNRQPKEQFIERWKKTHRHPDTITVAKHDRRKNRQEEQVPA